MKQLITFAYLFTISICFGQLRVVHRLGSCDQNSNPDYMNTNRLEHLEWREDTLVISIGLVEQCLYSPSVTARTNGDSLVLDIIDQSESYATCSCCFGLDVYVIGLLHKDYNLFNETSFIPIESKPKYPFPSIEELKTPRKTNKLNDEGLKIGYWIEKESKLKGNKYVYYYDILNGKSVKRWKATYSHQNELLELVLRKSYAKNDEENDFYFQIIEGSEYLRLMNQ